MIEFKMLFECFPLIVFSKIESWGGGGGGKEGICQTSTVTSACVADALNGAGKRKSYKL